MPFQPINFANIAPQGLPGVRDIPERFAAGFRASQLPQQAREQELINQLKQMELQQRPQEFQSQQELRQAQAQKAQQEAQQKELLGNILRQRMSGGESGQRGGQAGWDELSEALFRKEWGIPEELPGEKQKRELSSFEQKEKLKQKLASEEGENLTGSAKTELQSQINSIDNVLPDLKQLIKLTPGKLDLSGRASWNRKKDLIVDKLQKAQKLGANIPALETLKRILNRGWSEGNQNYLKDISGLGEDLLKQRLRAAQSLKQNKVLPEIDSTFSDKEGGQEYATKYIDGQQYFKRDGKWYKR